MSVKCPRNVVPEVAGPRLYLEGATTGVSDATDRVASLECPWNMAEFADFADFADFAAPVGAPNIVSL
jgi:hypothetical protein